MQKNTHRKLNFRTFISRESFKDEKEENDPKSSPTFLGFFLNINPPLP